MIRIKEYSYEHKLLLMTCDLCAYDFLQDLDKDIVQCPFCKNEDKLLWIKKKDPKWDF
jgi:predicted Zn-ribbon and HTH transcriptional regulator